MPHKRHLPPTLRRCAYCGALVPTKYECTCAESALIRRVYELFEGTQEVKE